jgi:hypothetical protein
VKFPVYNAVNIGSERIGKEFELEENIRIKFFVSLFFSVFNCFPTQLYISGIDEKGYRCEK